MRNRSKAIQFIKEVLKLNMRLCTVVFQDKKASVLIITSEYLDIDPDECIDAFREHCDFEWLQLIILDNIVNIKVMEVLDDEKSYRGLCERKQTLNWQIFDFR